MSIKPYDCSSEIKDLFDCKVNYAYAFDVSVPIHTLFRSCNIISSVFLGFCFFGMTSAIFSKS